MSIYRRAIAIDDRRICRFSFNTITYLYDILSMVHAKCKRIKHSFTLSAASHNLDAKYRGGHWWRNNLKSSRVDFQKDQPRWSPLMTMCRASNIAYEGYFSFQVYWFIYLISIHCLNIFYSSKSWNFANFFLF